MKMVKTNFLFLAVVAWLAGCATLMPSVVQHRSGNQITFTQKETGNVVSVKIAPPFEFQKIIKREHKGVIIKGHLFSDHTGSILVARLHHLDFQKLTGIKISHEAANVRDFPPKTIFAQQLCELVRTHTSTLAEYVIAAAYIKNLDKDKYDCESWSTIDDVSAAQPQLLKEFNAAGDKSINVGRQ